MKKFILVLLALGLLFTSNVFQINLVVTFDDNPPLSKSHITFDDNPPLSIIAFDDNPPLHKTHITFDDNPPLSVSFVAFDDNPPPMRKA